MEILLEWLERKASCRDHRTQWTFINVSSARSCIPWSIRTFRIELINQRDSLQIRNEVAKLRRETQKSFIISRDFPCTHLDKSLAKKKIVFFNPEQRCYIPPPIRYVFSVLSGSLWTGATSFPLSLVSPSTREVYPRWVIYAILEPMCAASPDTNRIIIPSGSPIHLNVLSRKNRRS